MPKHGMHTFEGMVSEEQIVEDYSYRPEIGLETVWEVRHHLGSHIEHSTAGCFGGILDHLGKAEISNFTSIPAILILEEEYVLALQIAMHDIAAMNRLRTIKNLC